MMLQSIKNFFRGLRDKLKLGHVAVSAEKRVQIADFVAQVRDQILDYQRNNSGKPGLFRIERLELEIAIETELAVDGKCIAFAVEAGANAKQNSTHRAKIVVLMAESTEKPPPASSTPDRQGESQKQGGGGGGGGRFIREFDEVMAPIEDV